MLCPLAANQKLTRGIGSGEKEISLEMNPRICLFPSLQTECFQRFGGRDGVATEKNELRAACSQGVAYARATLRYSAANMWLMGKLDKQSFTAWNSGEGGQGNPREGRSVVQYNREIQISLKKIDPLLMALIFFCGKMKLNHNKNLP